MCRWHTHTHPPPDLGSFTSGGRQTGSGIWGCVREDQGAGLNLGREGVVKGDIISVMSIISCPSSLCTCRDFSAGIHLFFKNWPSTPIPCGVQKAAYVASKTVIESFRTLVMKDEMMFFNLWSPSEHSFFFFFCKKDFPAFLWNVEPIGSTSHPTSNCFCQCSSQWWWCDVGTVCFKTKHAFFFVYFVWKDFFWGKNRKIN